MCSLITQLPGSCRKETGHSSDQPCRPAYHLRYDTIDDGGGDDDSDILSAILSEKENYNDIFLRIINSSCEMKMKIHLQFLLLYLLLFSRMHDVSGK